MRKNYYITSNGRLRRKDNTIALETEDETKKLPVKKVNAVHLLGQLDFNTRFFTFLSKENILAHYYDWFDYYRGSFYPKDYLNAGLVVVRQSRHYNDTDKRLVLAHEFVRGASHNMLQNLRYYRRKGKDVDAVIEEIEQMRERIDDTTTPEKLLGVEGKIRERYYSTFSTILREGFAFTERVKQPPNNEVNAMISFGNSMLYTSTLNEIYHTQLNPTVSYLHEPRERRFSLSLDISELFKPIIVDKSIFKLVNKQIIKEDDFDRDLNGCLLSDSGRDAFIEEFESRLEQTEYHEGLDRNVSFQRRLRLECYKLIKHLAGDQQYESYQA